MVSKRREQRLEKFLQQLFIQKNDEPFFFLCFTEFKSQPGGLGTRFMLFSSVFLFLFLSFTLQKLRFKFLFYYMYHIHTFSHSYIFTLYDSIYLNLIFLSQNSCAQFLIYVVNVPPLKKRVQGETPNICMLLGI